MSLPTDLMTPQQAAKALGCSVSSIYRAVKDGKLRGYRKFGSRLFISQGDLDAAVTPVVPKRPIEWPPRK